MLLLPPAVLLLLPAARILYVDPGMATCSRECGHGTRSHWLRSNASSRSHPDLSQSSLAVPVLHSNVSGPMPCDPRAKLSHVAGPSKEPGSISGLRPGHPEPDVAPTASANALVGGRVARLIGVIGWMGEPDRWVRSHSFFSLTSPFPKDTLCFGRFWLCLGFSCKFDSVSRLGVLSSTPHKAFFLMGQCRPLSYLDEGCVLLPPWLVILIIAAAFGLLITKPHSTLHGVLAPKCQLLPELC